MKDRKIDGLIAQHIFGWKWENIDFGWSNGHRGFLIPPDGPDHYSNEANWDGQYLKAMPNFCKDPAAAATVKAAVGGEVTSDDPREICVQALRSRGIQVQRPLEIT